MGDTGSLFLGLLLAWCAIRRYNAERPALNAVTAGRKGVPADLMFYSYLALLAAYCVGAENFIGKLGLRETADV